MDVSMTQLHPQTQQIPQFDIGSEYNPVVEEREQPKDDRSFGSPVPVYYDEEPAPESYYNQATGVRDNEFNIDKQTLIMIFAAFVVGLLLGSLRRPIILKS
jgi:hypothetical protein